MPINDESDAEVMVKATSDTADSAPLDEGEMGYVNSITALFAGGLLKYAVRLPELYVMCSVTNMPFTLHVGLDVHPLLSV